MRSSTLASFPGLAAEAMVRAYIEDVFNRISIALGSKLKRRLASGRWPHSGSAFCEGQQLARPGRVAQLLQCLRFDLANTPWALADAMQG